jgi:thioredoxin 1
MASANVVELTSANWDKEVVHGDKPVLVDFWAVWCGPCRLLSPTIDKLAEQYSGKIKVGKLNTDDHPDVAVRYGISGIPQVLLFKGSAEPVDRLIGNRPLSDFVQMVNRVLETPA